jgi:hypothetical protein
METQTIIEYEVTCSRIEQEFYYIYREEALASFDEGCMVFEVQNNHHTLGQYADTSLRHLAME